MEPAGLVSLYSRTVTKTVFSLVSSIFSPISFNLSSKNVVTVTPVSSPEPSSSLVTSKYPLSSVNAFPSMSEATTVTEFVEVSLV